MTWLNPISKVFFAAAFLVVTIWLLMETRSKRKPTLSEKAKAGVELLKEQQRLRDSASKAQAAKDQQHKSDSAKWKRTIDSASTQLSIKDKQLTKTQAAAAGLVADLNEAYEKKDTSQFVIKCLELGDSVTVLNNRVDQYKWQVDTLSRAKDSLQAVTQKRLEERDLLLSDLRRSITKTDSTSSSLQKVLKKATKKADKKYSIVVGGGPCISMEGRPGGAVGVFIGRTVIRL
jgi:hypothetical protein